MNDRLHAKRAATEAHILDLEAEESAGMRYTCHMPDRWFLIFGLICDVGWLLQLIFGMRLLAANTPSTAKAAIILNLLLIGIGVIYTIYLGKIHEKEIALRHQKNLSFGLTALGGILGIIIGYLIGSPVFLTGAVLNTIGALPIYLSFRKGICYGIQ